MNLYLIDGNNLAFRAHAAMPTLTVHDMPISAVFGSLKIVQTFQADWPVGKIVMPFDIGKSRYRTELFPEYKAHRQDDARSKGLHDTFVVQLTILHELMEKFGITTLTEEIRGYEADDVISYLVSRFRAGDFPNVHRVVILSADKDLCALVGEGVVWYDPIRVQTVTTENFVETFGISVEQYPDFKALKGDTSDNIPHPPGLGPKTAIKLLREYGTLESLLALGNPKIAQHADVVRLARRLVALDLHEQFPEDPTWARVDHRVRTPMQLSPDLVQQLEMLEFRSILEDLDRNRPRWESFASASMMDKHPFGRSSLELNPVRKNY